MLSKNQVKNITALHQKKFRREKNQFIAEGEKVVTELLNSGWTVNAIYGNQEFFGRFTSGIKIPKTTEIILVTDSELAKISMLTTPQLVVAVAEIPTAVNEINFDKGLKLVLDGINDPGNLGTIIRIADWFDINEIICSEDTAECFNPKVVQSSMGSLFRTSIHYEDLSKIFSKNSSNKKFPVYGTLLEGKNIYEEKLMNDGFILLGNESAGIRNELMKFVTDPVTIPSFNSSKSDSLNVAVAAGIFCSEFRRRM